MKDKRAVRAALRRTAMVVAFVLAATAFPALAQQAVAQHADVAEAQRLRDSGDLAGAAALLRAHLAQWPGDGDAARLLAQTLYWMKDIPGARAAYEAAYARHPEDSTLVLQYARMLAETGQRKRARELALPLTQLPATRAAANTLLGTLAYWEGDFTAAARLFTAALADDEDQEDAKRQLLEILNVCAPSVAVSSGIRHDDQPLDRAGLGLSARWFATPLSPLTLHVEPAGYWKTAGGTQQVTLADLALSNYAPSLHLETELAGGIVYRSYGTQTAEWQGHAAAGVRLGPVVALRGRVARTPYLSTVASLAIPVMVQNAAGMLHVSSSRGWLGEAGYQWTRFPDDNVATGLYAWLLAPLVHRGGNDLQIGYAFSADDTRESRFVLANPAQSYLPGDPRFSTAGVYAPYYTPQKLLTHSLVGSLVVHPSKATTFRAGAAYALRATEDAPIFGVSRGLVTRSFFQHTLAPWNARASFDFLLSPTVTMSASADFGRSSFYTWANAGLQVTRRFVSGPRRKSGTRQ